MNLEYFKNNILPENPGVYLFKKGKGILYIGKATSLKDRVKSYFSNDVISTRGPLIVDMVFKADKIDYIETDSVLEALILEAELIKKYQPKYNTKEKDNKSFNYVVITKEDYPRVLVERGRNLEKIQDLGFKIQEKFGPYTNGTQLKEAIKIIRKIFPFRDKCIPYFPHQFASSPRNASVFLRPCFNYQIGLCPGVCVGLITKKEYQKTIKNIKLFFEGKKKQILKNLEKEMSVFAKNQQFEKANNIKKTIFALQHIRDVSLIKKDEYFNFPQYSASSPRYVRVEAYDVAHLSGTNNVGVMTVIENGEINKNEYRKFIIKDSRGSDTGALKEILERRFKHLEWTFPQIIVVDGGKAQINIARKIVDRKIEVVSVLKDEHHKPKAILGSKKVTEKYSDAILLVNSEAHRFAIKYHRQKRSFLK
ncbi:MAG: GIY-YIG nuclease family protein [Candidatus Pacebacteria bacterium]|nr:GIY-YIG nuclease family protein [Candidatus Paceibacterota bacterium]